MDQVLKQLGIERIFSTPYHPQSNGKLEVFHKYLIPTLKRSCEKDPSNWDKYNNQVLASYRVTPNLATAEIPFFLVFGRDPNLLLDQLLEPMQQFLGDPDSGMINLEAQGSPQLSLRRHWMKIASQLHRRPLTDNHHPSRYGTGYMSRRNNQASVTSNGDWDTEFPKLSVIDMFCL